MCPKALQLIMISDNNYDITQLLLLTIIDSGKKCIISIIDKRNIAVNRQNWLITHTCHKALQMLETIKQEALQLEPVLESYGACKFSHTFPIEKPFNYSPLK